MRYDQRPWVDEKQLSGEEITNHVLTLIIFCNSSCNFFFISLSCYFFNLQNVQVTVLDPYDSSTADKSAPRFVQSLPEEIIVMENHCHEFQTGIIGKTF